MNNHFVFLVCSYNNERWVKSNLDSVLCQTYPNWIVVYYNAASTDKTYELAKEYASKDPRIHLHTTSERQMKTWFLQHLSDYETILDNDVVCILDGDDFLANEEVLYYMNEVYNKINCWMTYGGMVVWKGGDSTEEPHPQNSEAPIDVKRDKLYRRDMWRYSHFRTYRGFLWNRIKREDWVSDNHYVMIEDLMTMYPCMEMCPSHKIFRIDQTVYILNYSADNGGSRGCTENKINNIGQLQEMKIRNRPKYEELIVVCPTLAGGLGNQMFEVAAAASLAKDNNTLLLINPSEHILPNQGRNINTYLNNVFHRIATDNAPPVKVGYSWDHFYYAPIPYQPNIKLGGHFQSYKYFDHNRQYIRDLFAPTFDVRNHIAKTYPQDKSKITAIQVRRGDYYKFPNHHPLLTPDYYAKAVKMASAKEVWVFSDDIEWCKENLHFDCPIRYVKDEDYIEMYLMSLCKNLVIANSSFGWWAAYLKNTPGQIFAPHSWFGPSLIAEGFKHDDLVPNDWITPN